MKKKILLYLIQFVFISACNTKPTETLPPQTALSTPTIAAIEIDPVVQTDELEKPVTNSLPPEPIKVTFSTEDYQELEGIFFPASFQSAPIIVLMHWYPGDQYEWTEIAYWLQNRGLKGDLNGVPWKDPSWFPALKSGDSFNILTFTFRGCAGGCNSFQQDAWPLDAKAALTFARTLEGVDPDRVISIGASIGADGAIDGCAAVLEDDPTACLGAFSFSPGNYLNIKYSEMVNILESSDLPRPAWCLFDINDLDSIICDDIKGDYYYKESWSGGNLHGMHLITPNLDPMPLERLLEFLALVLEN